MRKNFIFTSESVSEGHPDKLCDRISDAIVDRFLQQDPYASIIAESAVSQSIVFIAAQFASTAMVDIPNVARSVINNVGYTDEVFSGKTCAALTSLQELPIDESLRFDETALSDDEIERITVRHHQVNSFGFACDQTDVFMPMPIYYAHILASTISKAGKKGVLDYLSPDIKVQTGIEYKDGKAIRIYSLSLQVCQKKRADGIYVPDKTVRDDITQIALEHTFNDYDIKPDSKTLLFIRHECPETGCGPATHSGLTGRKNAIDTYGEYARHSGAALSGKDPRRIDRIGAYAARYAAKNVVAAGIAHECEVQISYSIGLSKPVSLQVETFGTGKISDSKIAKLIQRHFDFRPAAIMAKFQLRKLPSTIKGGFFAKLSAFGHVGRKDIDLPWEALDKVEALKAEQ